MIPVLYDQTEKDFTSAGLGFLADCESCTVTEELNGVYECEFTYPITGPLYEALQGKRIVYVAHDDTGDPQPFDIYAHSAPINGLVTFYAHHISYRLSNAVVMPFSATSVANAISGIQANIVTDQNDDFSFWTDVNVAGEFAITVPSIVRNILGGDEYSLLKVYGAGDFEFDKFDVKLYQDLGEDTNVEIRFGKNLVNIEDKIDRSESYNAIVPYWLNEDDNTLVTIDEGFVSYSDGTSWTKAVPVQMNDYFETKPTKAQLKTRAQQLLEASEGWKPSEELTVDFVQLWQTEEYKEYAPLQRARLGDYVRVYYQEIGVDAVRERVVRTVYNALLDRYDEITLNQLPSTLFEMTSQQVGAGTSGSDTKINLAIALIRGGVGGYIAIPANAQGYNSALYVLDQPDVTEATHIFRFGSNGMTYSDDGIDGTFKELITMNGEHVTINGSSMVKLGSGALSVLLSNNILGQMLAITVGGEDVLAIKATNPFVLTNGAGALGYRYGGTAGSGSYGAPHYFNGDLKINGNLTVSGTINGN